MGPRYEYGGICNARQCALMCACSICRHRRRLDSRRSRRDGESIKNAMHHGTTNKSNCSVNCICAKRSFYGSLPCKMGCASRTGDPFHCTHSLSYPLGPHFSNTPRNVHLHRASESANCSHYTRWHSIIDMFCGNRWWNDEQNHSFDAQLACLMCI